MTSAQVELVRQRVPEGLILYLRHLASPWMFRVMPVRYPDQPRLWCLRVEACAGASLSAKTAPVDPLYTSLAMSREQLGDTLEAIQADPAAWLGLASQKTFSRWVTEITRLPVPADFIPPEPAHRAARVAPSPTHPVAIDADAHGDPPLA